MAQNKAQASELARQAIARGGHSIKSAVGGSTDMSEDVLEMTDRLVRAQYGLLRSLVHSAGSVASRSGDASGEAGGD